MQAIRLMGPGLVVAVLVMGAISAAQAQGSPSSQQSPKEPTAGMEQEARSLFEAGRVAFREGRFESALEHFERAYDLSDKPELLYNIGVAADRLRRDDKAIDAFERYLEERPDAPNRSQVEARLEVLRRKSGGAGAGTPKLDDGSDVSKQPGRKHTGFYLRAAIGVAAGFAEQDFPDGAALGIDSLSLRGGGLGIDIAIGGAVTENLVLHGELFGTELANPTVELDLGAGSVEGEASSASIGAIAAGITYYFMPRNVYLSGALGVAGATTKYDNPSTGMEEELKSDAGVALRAAAGKEWWVFPEWGIGIAGALAFFYLPDEPADLNAVTAQVLFTTSWS